MTFQLSKDKLDLETVQNRESLVVLITCFTEKGTEIKQLLLLILCFSVTESCNRFSEDYQAEKPGTEEHQEVHWLQRLFTQQYAVQLAQFAVRTAALPEGNLKEV